MDCKVGDTASIKCVLSPKIVEGYGTLSGDMNPIHFCDTTAVKYGFKGRIAHGLFCVGLISNLIGNILPGPGSIFLDEQLRYHAPVYIGDEIEAIVCITDIRSNGVVDVKFKCKNQNGIEVLSGVTRVLVKSAE